VELTFASKLGHALGAFVAAGAVGLVLLAWRDRESLDIDDRIVALVTMCLGLLFGVAWELIEFVLDWVRNSDLQFSNLDTMSDLLWNDVGAVVAGSVVVSAYCHLLGANVRARLGALAVWLFDGPSRVLDKHGFLMTIVVTLIAASAVAVLWFTGRPVPGFPIG
jgi:hypothetical protein